MKAHDGNVGGVVICEGVVENFDFVIGHNNKAVSRIKARYQRSFFGEVVMIVFCEGVVKYTTSVTFFLWQIGECEDKHATGIVLSGVVINIGTDGVFDFDAGDVVFGKVVAHDDVFALAHVNTGVGCANGGTVFDEDVGALNGVEAIGTVFGAGFACPFDAYVFKEDSVDILDFDGIALGVFDGDVFDGETALGDEEAFAAGSGFLVFEAEDGFVSTFSSEGDVFDIE